MVSGPLQARQFSVRAHEGSHKKSPNIIYLEILEYSLL